MDQKMLILGVVVAVLVIGTISIVFIAQKPSGTTADEMNIEISINEPAERSKITKSDLISFYANKFASANIKISGGSIAENVKIYSNTNDSLITTTVYNVTLLYENVDLTTPDKFKDDLKSISDFTKEAGDSWILPIGGIAINFEGSKSNGKIVKAWFRILLHEFTDEKIQENADFLESVILRPLTGQEVSEAIEFGKKNRLNTTGILTDWLFQLSSRYTVLLATPYYKIAKQSADDWHSYKEPDFQTYHNIYNKDELTIYLIVESAYISGLGESGKYYDADLAIKVDNTILTPTSTDKKITKSDNTPIVISQGGRVTGSLDLASYTAVNTYTFENLWPQINGKTIELIIIAKSDEETYVIDMSKLK